MKTRDKIIDCAIRLFNEKGTTAISTNHIAAAAEISPGNLYYHFRNKEDIIFAIFEQMDVYGTSQYQSVIDSYPSGTVESLERTFLMIQKFNWRYRFFKRELTTLVMNIPPLKERFRATNIQTKEMIRFAIDSGIANETIHPLDVSTKNHLVDAIWLVALFWLNYLEVGGEDVNDTTLRRGNSVLHTILGPHLNTDS
jgi:AcrR family transcriptional regulator